MEEWKEKGILNKHDLAWSRTGEDKVYVQHLMRKNGFKKCTYRNLCGGIVSIHSGWKI